MSRMEKNNRGGSEDVFLQMLILAGHSEERLQFLPLRRRAGGALDDLAGLDHSVQQGHRACQGHDCSHWPWYFSHVNRGVRMSGVKDNRELKGLGTHGRNSKLQ